MSDHMDHLKLDMAINSYSWAKTLNPEAGIVLAAARAHLATLPKTKLVTVWRVEYGYATPSSLTVWRPGVHVFDFLDQAERRAEEMRAAPELFACIKVIGPHQQQIPA